MLFVRRLIIIFLYLLFIVFIPLRLEAVNLTFRVEPSKIRLSIPAGSSQAGTIRVYSQSGDKIEIKVYMEDWLYTKIQDGSKDFFPAKTTPFSCADWITFNPSEFIIPPYGVQNINYVVRVPADAQGGRFAVMFFETVFLRGLEDLEYPQAEEVRSGATLNIRLGVLFYTDVKDRAKLLAELSNFSVLKDPKNNYLLISTDFKNVGNTDIGAGGTFHIMDNEGVVYARGEFKNIYTLPGDGAKLTATWKETLPKGKYDLVLTLDLGKYREEIGRGTILVKEAKIEIGDNGEVVRVGALK